MRIRSNLALILFGMILGALSYRGLNSLVVDRAPAVAQPPAAGADTGPVKWENDTVAPLTKILPSHPEKRRLPMEWLFPGEHTDRRQRTRVPASRGRLRILGGGKRGCGRSIPCWRQIPFGLGKQADCG